MVYEWNAEKAKVSIQKHGVSFDEAATVFLDPLALTFPDPLGHEGRPEESAGNMKKASAKRLNDDLRPEYDLSQLKGAFAASTTGRQSLEPT